MALQSLIFKPNGDVQLNSLKRYCLSGVVVPSQDNAVAQLAAGSATNPTRSRLIPIQGPTDGKSEIYSLTGKESLVTQGVGTITTTGTTTVTGSGTKFLAQMQVGTAISTAAGFGTIASISSDTVATTAVAMAVNASANYFVTVVSNNLPNMSVLINDQGWRRYLMNRDVPLSHVFGSNTKPLFLKESLLLETDQTLQLQFLNYGNATASFAPIFEGRKWQMEALNNRSVFDYIAGLRERKTYIQPYWLTLDNRVAVVNANSSKQAFFTCTGDVTLVLFNVYGTAIDNAVTDLSNSVTLSFHDAKTMRSMQSQPMPLSLCTGTNENPFRLSSPWIVEPQTQIKVTARNLSNSTANVYLTFHGVAIYTGSNYRGSTLTNKNLIREASKMYEAMSVPTIVPASPQN